MNFSAASKELSSDRDLSLKDKDDRKENQTSKVTELFRGAARPIVTIIFAATIAQVVVEGIETPEWFIVLASTVILWWFGDRTVRRIRKGKGED